jgi:mannose-6-phosphate isomerase-like protein (cupin superfamily)
MSDYTKVHYDLDDLPLWVHPLRRELELRRVAVGLIRVPRGQGYSFLHRHREQEEVYVVLGGTGLIRVEDQDIPLGAGDLVRVSPSAFRALKADEDSDLVVLCTGGVTGGYPKDPETRVLIDDGIPDFDHLPPWYEGNEKVRALNQKLKREYESRQARIEK